jgi:molybdate transport system ATP-binding protein
MSIYVEIEKKFKGFNLDVKIESDRKRIGILGASGCGKSMILKCIAGIEKPDRGKILLNGRVLYDSKQKIDLPPQQRDVGYLFQNYALFPNMTVKENIGIAISNNKDKKLLVEKMLTLLHLQDLEDRYPMQLSGGQQQRVALARIFAYKPKLFMLDEPFSALDSYLKDQLQQELLDTLNVYEGDTLMVPHNRDEIYRFCDTMSVIDRGKLICAGDTSELFKNPIYETAARLTGCKNISKAKKQSDYEIAAVDWNVTLKTEQFVNEDIKYVGIRAHDVKSSEDDRMDNNFAVNFAGMSEGPFEINLMFINSMESRDNATILWKVSKSDWENKMNRRIPHYISLPKEHLILLK